MTLESLTCVLAREDRLASSIPGTEHLNPEDQQSSSRTPTPSISLSRLGTPLPQTSSLLHGAALHSASLKTGLIPQQNTSGPSAIQDHSKLDVSDWLHGSDSDDDFQTDNPFGDSNGQGDLGKEGADGDSDVGSKHGDESDKDEDKDVDADSEDDDGEDEGGDENGQGGSKLTTLQIYLKEKEERIAARKAMEESLAQEWADLAQEFKKPSPKKRRPRQPKKTGIAPSRRSVRTSGVDTSNAPATANLNPPSPLQGDPSNADSSSTHAPPPLQKPDGSQREDRQGWPEWLCVAVDELGDYDDPIWMGLMTKFIALEQKLGYPTGMVCL
jgi:hypothetical protein